VAEARDSWRPIRRRKQQTKTAVSREDPGLEEPGNIRMSREDVPDPRRAGSGGSNNEYGLF